MPTRLEDRSNFFIRLDKHSLRELWRERDYVIGEVLVAHLVGDYVLQSHWMATEKTKRWFPAIVHGVTYTLPFLFITQSPIALLIICVTHIIIDHFRLAKHISWLKNQIGPKAFRFSWQEGKETGFAPEVPIWLSTWLMIILDNTIHILINIAAIMLF